MVIKKKNDQESFNERAYPMIENSVRGNSEQIIQSSKQRSCGVTLRSIYLLLFALVGCQYNPFAHRFLTREPCVEEVVGTYCLEEVYVDMVEDGLSAKIRSHESKPTIILRSDGSFVMQAFPLFREKEQGFDYTFEGFQDLVGCWKITAVGAVSSGRDEAATVYGISLELPKKLGFLSFPNLTGDETVDGMIFTLYDGDQGQVLGYKKQITVPSDRAGGG
jgi:hypothetical protein